MSTNAELQPLYKFYKANIHEKRVAAYVCRFAPLASVVIVSGVCFYGFMKEQVLLLSMSAFFNVSLWMWAVSMAVTSIYASVFMLQDLELGPLQKATQKLPPPPATCGEAVCNDYSLGGCSGGTGESGTGGRGVVHLIVLPNYKEDERMLAETLRSLAEAEDSNNFWIVLGMEAREGEAGKQKAERLQMRFGSKFARVFTTCHPENLTERHLDGSEDMEVPGKASNLKYAVAKGYQECSDAGIHLDSVMLTVADADCIFHPRYFGQVGHEFQHLRANEEKGGSQHRWTMWQAPQLPYRNYYTAPVVSRVWSYIASTYEFGGLSGTAFGQHHMVYSSYSMPLLLAHDAGAWDGDVVAEDHHAWLKCFYYSLYEAALQEPGKANSGAIVRPHPTIQIRPVFLPVKSTSVASENWWQSWADRWFQAKRHAQGVAELSYALLATYDACRTCLWRKNMLTWRRCCRLGQVLVRIWCMHVLPICQTICLGMLTIKWVWHKRSIQGCPDRLWFFGNLNDPIKEEQYLLCGLAGAWVLTWPVVIPWALIVVSNFILIHQVFLRPAVYNRYESIWHSEDGKVPNQGRISHNFTALGLILLDTIFGMSWILVPYGFLVEIVAYFNVAFYGNRFSYVTASKWVGDEDNAGDVEQEGAMCRPEQCPPLLYKAASKQRESNYGTILPPNGTGNAEIDVEKLSEATEQQSETSTRDTEENLKAIDVTSDLPPKVSTSPCA